MEIVTVESTNQISYQQEQQQEQHEQHEQHEQQHEQQHEHNGMLYTPAWWHTILLAMQHFLTMLPTAAALPSLLFTPLCLNNPRQQSAFVSTGFFVAGVGTLLASSVGSRLPTVQAASAVFLAPAIELLEATELPACRGNYSGDFEEFDDEAVWRERLVRLAGTVAIAGVLRALLGFAGITAALATYSGPLVTGSTIFLLGVSLVPPTVAKAEGNWYVALGTCSLVVTFSLLLSKLKVPVCQRSHGKWQTRRRRIFSAAPVLMAIALSWIVCAVLTAAGAFPSDPNSWSYTARTDIRSDAVAAADWLRMPYPGQFGRPGLLVSGLPLMLMACLISVPDSLGMYHAAAEAAAAPAPAKFQINRGICCEGFVQALAGLLGLPLGTANFAENVGLLSLSGVSSRRVIQASAVPMLACGLCPKLVSLFVSLPDPVVGGLFLSAFGVLCGVGLANAAAANLRRVRNCVVLGLSVFIGICLPYFLRQVNSTGDTRETEILNGFQGASRVAMESVTALLKMEICVGAFLAFVLDNCLPGSRLSRGFPDSTESKADLVKSQLQHYDLTCCRLMAVKVPQLQMLPVCPAYNKLEAATFNVAFEFNVEDESNVEANFDMEDEPNVHFEFKDGDVQ